MRGQLAARGIELAQVRAEIGSMTKLAAELRARIEEERSAHQATQRLLAASLAPARPSARARRSSGTQQR